jgi:Ca2+-binding EF-hand superfamily protein
MAWLATFDDIDAQFRVLDANGDGFVTHDELSKAVQPSISSEGQRSQPMMRCYNNIRLD